MGRLTPEERAGIWDLVDEVLEARGIQEFSLLPYEQYMAVADAVSGLMQALEEVEACTRN